MTHGLLPPAAVRCSRRRRRRRRCRRRRRYLGGRLRRDEIVLPDDRLCGSGRDDDNVLRVPAFKDRQNARILNNGLDAQGIAIAGIVSSKIIERNGEKFVRMNDAFFLSL